jgi:hypothetical protein
VIPELLQPEVAAFILQNESADVHELLLKHKTIHGVPASLVADQIRGRQKAREKLPTLYGNSQVIYPPALNLEQSSSELTAVYKLKFIKRIFNGARPAQGADLTGGFGIDALFISTAFDQYHFVEPNPGLIAIARHNHQVCSARNIAYENVDAEEFLRIFSGKFDLVYIDPSRRLSGNRKVFSLADCEPNIVDIQHTIYNKTNRMLIKASPLLDLQTGIREIVHVKKVLILSSDNECREVLFYCEKNFTAEPVIQAVILSDKYDNISFEFLFSDERPAEAPLSEPQNYLYEPDAALLKAGAFKLIALRFGLSKLHPNTHLYTSINFIESFPGRIFRLEALVKPDPKVVRNYFPEGKANVTTRNYPLTVAELRKKTGLKDGGEKYLIGFTDVKQKSVAVAERIK